MRTILKHLLNFFADAWAQAARFHFPKKYGWREKIAMLGGSYERETGVLLREIVKPGMTVVDIGAHIGYFTRLLSKAVGPGGRVFAFEPEPENFSLLYLNTKNRPKERVPSISVIKMEIGGAEPLALKCMSELLREGRCALVMEFNPEALRTGGTAPENFLASLEERGFAVSAILPRGLEPLSAQDPNWNMILEGNASVNIYVAKK